MVRQSLRSSNIQSGWDSNVPMQGHQVSEYELAALQDPSPTRCLQLGCRRFFWPAFAQTEHLDAACAGGSWRLCSSKALLEATRRWAIVQFYGWFFMWLINHLKTSKGLSGSEWQAKWFTTPHHPKCGSHPKSQQSDCLKNYHRWSSWVRTFGLPL